MLRTNSTTKIKAMGSSANRAYTAKDRLTSAMNRSAPIMTRLRFQRSTSVPATPPNSAAGRKPANDAAERTNADCVVAVRCQINAICNTALVKRDAA